MTPIEAAAAAAELAARLERLATLDLNPVAYADAIADSLGECGVILAQLTEHVADATSESVAFRCGVRA